MQESSFSAMNINELWESVLVDVELSVSGATYTTWFKDTAIAKHEDGVIYLSVPNQFVRDWLQTKYHKTILKALRDRIREIRSVEYVISKRSSGKQSTYTPRAGELPLGSRYVSREDNLNPRYDFESFIIGPFNELAYTAAQAVIKNPGQSYNPLFLYGNTGHGKTHLIQAVGNRIKELYPGKRIFYLTSEKFYVDFVNSVQANRINQFKEKYRVYDVLIMDDVQFLASKEKTQEELFHLFNTLYDGGKQIVFSSDKHPNFISGLEERLKSRFGAGMIVDIPPPDSESRIEIIKSKAKLMKLTLSKKACEHIAETIQGNIRELEGILNTIICQAELKGHELDLSEILSITKRTIQPKKNVSVKEIIKKISGFYNIDEESIYEKTRRKEVVRPRQVIMYILREDFQISYPAIGEKLGGRDHTTVIHSCDRVKKELKTNTDLYSELDQIRAII